MAPDSIGKKIATKQAAQQKLTDEIAELKREQSKKMRAEREKAERRIGRLAVNCGLHSFTKEQLQPLFQMAAKQLGEQGQNGRGADVTTQSDDELVAAD